MIIFQISIRICYSINVLLHVSNRLVDIECVLHEHGIIHEEASNWYISKTKE
jgi:hypothetical protein